MLRYKILVFFSQLKKKDICLFSFLMKIFIYFEKDRQKIHNTNGKIYNTHSIYLSYQIISFIF